MHRWTKTFQTYALPLAGWLIAMWTAAGVLSVRLAAEAGYGSVERVADLAAFEQLASAGGEEVDEILASLASRGVTSLAVEEMTPARLVQTGRATLLSGSEILQYTRRLNELASLLRQRLERGEIRPQAAYLLMSAAEPWERVREEACRRLEGDCRTWEDGGAAMLEAGVGVEEFAAMGLGIWPEDLDRAHRHGFHVVLRFRDAPGWTPELLHREVDRAAQAVDASAVVFVGDAVLGATDGLVAETAAAIRRHDLVVGLIEAPDRAGHIQQQGMEALLREVDVRAARVFSPPPEQLAEETVPDAASRWLQAVRERNARMLYFRPLSDSREQAWSLSKTLAVLERVDEALREQGWPSGPVEPFPFFRLSATSTIFLLLGAVSLVTLALVSPVTVFWKVGGLVSVGWGGLGLLGLQFGFDAARETALWLAGWSVPMLAASLSLRSASGWKRVALVFATAMSGGMMAAALAADARYALGLQSVSMGPWLPLGALVMTAYVWFRQGSGAAAAPRATTDGAAWLSAWDQPVLWRQLLGFVGFVLLCGAIGYHTWGPGIAVWTDGQRAWDALWVPLLGGSPRALELIGYPLLVRGGAATDAGSKGISVLGAAAVTISLLWAWTRTGGMLTAVPVTAVAGLFLGMIIGWAWVFLFPPAGRKPSGNESQPKAERSPEEGNEP